MNIFMIEQALLAERPNLAEIEAACLDLLFRRLDTREHIKVLCLYAEALLSMRHGGKASHIAGIAFEVARRNDLFLPMVDALRLRVLADADSPRQVASHLLDIEAVIAGYRAQTHSGKSSKAIQDAEETLHELGQTLGRPLVATK